MRQAVIVKHIFVFNTQLEGSFVRLWWCFSTWTVLFFFYRRNLTESGSWNFRVQERERRGKERFHTKRRGADLHVSTSIQTERQARQRGLGAKESILVQIFKDCWLASSCVGLGAGSTHSSLWLQLMKHSCCFCLPSTWHMQNAQIQATAKSCGCL